MSQKTTFQPRKGQQDLIKYLPQIQGGETISVQWPTGYGKSIGFALAWKYCFETEIANRFLLVVANDTQRQQVINDFAGDCQLVNAPVPGGIWAFERSGGDIRAARVGDVLVFVCSVQQLDASTRGGVNTLKDMLTQKGTKWFIGFDEFHHYGEDMSWGNAAKAAMQFSAFTLAMSATPYRRGSDTIFPEPKLIVLYQEGVDGKCVKPIICHSYEYSVAVVEDGEEVASYTTTDLQRISGGDLDKWEERKNIRYSPQYLHPLIMHPIRRLREQRAMTGKRLQMLMRAMSCRHAKMLCEQVKIFADGLSVDWIGTNGRTDKENRAVLDRFCPPKDMDGKRADPAIDVLIQVSMAGEGFDSVNVCEIVDLFPVSQKALSGRATQDKQFYGRGARMICGAEDVPLRVNIPSDHPLHIWAGKSLAEWMDATGPLDPPEPSEDGNTGGGEFDYFDFPELAKKREIELITVITDQKLLQQFSNNMAQTFTFDVTNPHHKEELARCFLVAANEVQEKQSAQTRIFQVREYLDAAVGRMAHNMAKKTDVVSGAMIGKFKKDVNGLIKRRFGKSRDEMSEDELEIAATWIRNEIKSMKGLGL